MMRLRGERIKGLYQGFWDLLFPRNDLLADEPLEYDNRHGLYCGAIALRYLRAIREPFCHTCGFPLYGKADEAIECQQCTHLKPVFESNRSVLLLNRLGKRMVHELKYHQGQYLLADFERIIAEAKHMEEWIKNSLLVPVPLHNRKLRERGYNQSQLLAEAFQHVWGNSNTEIQDLLCRDVDTETQTRMDRKKRIQNVKGAFSLKQCLSEKNLRIPITLIDDVFTTGSTINECARALEEGGFQVIRSITFGHG